MNHQTIKKPAKLNRIQILSGRLCYTRLIALIMVKLSFKHLVINKEMARAVGPFDHLATALDS